MTGQPTAAEATVRDALYAAEPDMRRDSAVAFMAASDRARVAVSALAAAGLLVTPGHTGRAATSLDDLVASAERWHDPEVDPEGPAVLVADLAAALPQHDTQVAARALRERGAAWAETSAPGGIVDDWGRGWAACRDAVVHDLIERGEAT